MCFGYYNIFLIPGMRGGKGSLQQCVWMAGESPGSAEQRGISKGSPRSLFNVHTTFCGSYRPRSNWLPTRRRRPPKRSLEISATRSIGVWTPWLTICLRRESYQKRYAEEVLIYGYVIESDCNTK